jgi:hypothetical protein
MCPDLTILLYQSSGRPGVDLRGHLCKPTNERTTGGLDWSNALLDGCGAVELDRHVNDTGLLSAKR